MSIHPQSSPQQLATQLHSASIHLLRRMRKHDESSGLSAPRLSALSVIVLAGPVTLSDLAAAEQVRPPTMTRIVSALEDQGLVTRRQNAQDGRSILLSATRAGKKLLIASRNRRVAPFAHQINALAESQRIVLEQAVQIIAALVRTA